MGTLLRRADHLFDIIHRGVGLEVLNLGGGLATHYRALVPRLAIYAEAIEAALAREFGGSGPRLLTEPPGRYPVGDAALLCTEIVLISKKSAHERERWVYLGAGLYNGLYETLNERIILYRRHPYELPVDLTIGDTVDFFSAGAYTASIAALRSTDFRRSAATSFCISAGPLTRSAGRRVAAINSR